MEVEVKKGDREGGGRGEEGAVTGWGFGVRGIRVKRRVKV